MTELISVNLQRYFDNKDKYNIRAKEYFNNVYYIQNREAILEKGRLYRVENRRAILEKGRLNRANQPKQKDICICNNNNLTVSFD